MSREPIDANNKRIIPQRFDISPDGEPAIERRGRNPISAPLVPLVAADFHLQPEFNVKGARPRKLCPQLPPINRFDLDQPIPTYGRAFLKRFPINCSSLRPCTSLCVPGQPRCGSLAYRSQSICPVTPTRY